MSKKQAVYYCAVCGKEYTSIVERANCELVCAKRVEEEAKKSAEAKKKAEQKERKAKLDAVYEEFNKLREEYIKDYGCYIYTTPAFKENTKDDMAFKDVMSLIFDL